MVERVESESTPESLNFCSCSGEKPKPSSADPGARRGHPRGALDLWEPVALKEAPLDIGNILVGNFAQLLGLPEKLIFRFDRI